MADREDGLAGAFACHRFSVVRALADRVRSRWHVAGRLPEFFREDNTVRWTVDENGNEKRISPAPKKADQDCALHPRAAPNE